MAQQSFSFEGVHRNCCLTYFHLVSFNVDGCIWHTGDRHRKAGSTRPSLKLIKGHDESESRQNDPRACCVAIARIIRSCRRVKSLESKVDRMEIGVAGSQLVVWRDASELVSPSFRLGRQSFALFRRHTDANNHACTITFHRTTTIPCRYLIIIS
jgi:hypothetical protein